MSCGKAFNRSSALKWHIKNVHTKPRKPKSYIDLVGEDVAREGDTLMEFRDPVWSCTLCNYTSKSRSHMKEHVEKHIMGMKCYCQVCGKTFKRSSALRGHIRNKHTLSEDSAIKHQNVSGSDL